MRFALREILHDGLRASRSFELRVSRRADPSCVMWNFSCRMEITQL